MHPAQGQGRLEACLTLVEDITARREAEARYRTLVEHAPEAILLFNPEGGIIDANANALRLFRLARSELLGRKPSELSPRSASSFWSSLRGGTCRRACRSSADAAPIHRRR